MAKQTTEKKGIIEVRLVNPKKTGTVTVRNYTDIDTGELREFKDAHGNLRIKKYTKALTILRMDNQQDVLEYLHVKDHPLYVKSSYPLLKVIDVTEEAESRISMKDESLDALIEAKGLRGDKLVNFARVLGIETHNLLEVIIKDRIYQKAESDPKGFLSAFNDPNRTFKEILHKGKVKNVFTHKNNIWKFRDVLMGGNIDEAILWLKDNEDLMPSIRKELSSID